MWIIEVYKQKGEICIWRIYAMIGFISWDLVFQYSTWSPLNGVGPWKVFPDAVVLNPQPTLSNKPFVHFGVWVWGRVDSEGLLELSYNLLQQTLPMVRYLLRIVDFTLLATPLHRYQKCLEINSMMAQIPPLSTKNCWAIKDIRLRISVPPKVKRSQISNHHPRSRNVLLRSNRWEGCWMLVHGFCCANWSCFLPGKDVWVVVWNMFYF